MPRGTPVPADVKQRIRDIVERVGLPLSTVGEYEDWRGTVAMPRPPSSTIIRVRLGGWPIALNDQREAA